MATAPELPQEKARAAVAKDGETADKAVFEVAGKASTLLPKVDDSIALGGTVETHDGMPVSEPAYDAKGECSDLRCKNEPWEGLKRCKKHVEMGRLRAADRRERHQRNRPERSK